MLEFTKAEKNLTLLNTYFQKTNTKICDYSVGVKYIWQKEYINYFAIYNDTLILKEDSENYKDKFYFPIGNDIDGALKKIENYCKEKKIPLKFCWVTNEQKNFLLKKYYDGIIETPREWNDYLYDAESFKSFTGKKYNGQRNHINKFKKLYPNYVIKKYDENDINIVNELLFTYENKNDITSHTAKVEDLALRDYISNIKKLNQLALIIKVDNKCIAFSSGEIVNETLIVHVEKALTEYEGIYPFIANEFVKTYANEKVKYVNREEDCGDEGLRTSKLQYHPIQLIEKNSITFNTIFDNIKEKIYIKTERLEITEIEENDKNNYFLIYIDEKLNKFWGYDYKEDLKDKEATPDYFYDFQKKLKSNKDEYSLAIKLKNNMIGEIVLHNFDYSGNVEIGFRILEKYQKNGFTYEATLEVIKYIFNNLKANSIKAKCYKQNTPSKKLIEKLKFNLTSEDVTYFYFELLR